MLKDCLEVFKNVLEKSEGDKLIIDSYIPADGTYIIVSPKDETYEIKDVINIKLDKKTKEIDKSNEYYEDVCKYDYNSKLIDMNKPIDGKKIIQSNNYLSFIVKKESLINGKLCDERIEEYYNKLANPYLKYDKGNSKEIYKSVEAELGKVNVEKLEKIKNWIRANIFSLDVEITGKDYLKIFFEDSIEEYKREGKRYLIPNIYNNNDFNVNDNDEIYGLPNDNMGLNAKKPYLENKTRKITVPYLLSNTEVLLQKKFFDYLMNFAVIGKVNVYIDNSSNKITSYESGKLPDKDFNGIFLRIKKGKEVEILDYDIITNYKSNLSRKFNFKNILEVDQSSKNVSIQNYGEWGKFEDIQQILNEVFFSKFLINNYFTEPGDLSINDGCLKNNLLLSRNILFNWIYKGVDNGVFNILNKISLSLVKGSIENGYIQKASHQFNLRWSLINYFKGGRDMADVIHILKDSLRTKINSRITDKIYSDDEYYFAVGQLVGYLLSKSRGKKKPHSLANPFVNGKNNEDIKEKLRRLYSKYSYDLDSKGKKFNNLYTMVIGYTPEDKNVNQDLILGGYLSNSLIYESTKGVEISE